MKFFTIRHLLLGGFALSIITLSYAMDRDLANLADAWMATKRAESIAGVYENRCEVASHVGTNYTGLILLLLGDSALKTSEVKSAIKRVKIEQAAKKLSVTAEDIGGNTVIRRDLEEGRDYQIERREIVITKKWNANDEWGPGQGTGVTRLARSVDGHLLVKSVVLVRGWTFIFPKRNEVTYYFRFTAAQVSANR